MIDKSETYDSLAELSTMISKRAGLIFSTEQQARMRAAIASRQETLGFSCEEYVEFLKDAASSAAEWQDLVNALTVGETYFFRDAAQLEIIEKQLLPKIIERRKTEKTLSIFSAACSTGQEAYTLAMILSRTLPDPEQWQIKIIGGDINTEYLKTAREAKYSAWSFRRDSNNIQKIYFRRTGDCWQLCEEIKRMATFVECNLLDDSLPDHAKGINDLDLIICRNVFIYFSQEGIAEILEKFYNSLGDGGYLITGHSELSSQDTSKFSTRMYPQTLVYQKTRGNLTKASNNKVTPPLSRTTTYRRGKKQLTKQVNKLPAKLNTKSLTDPASLPDPAQTLDSPKPDELCALRSLEDLLRQGLISEAHLLLETEINEISCRGAMLANAWANIGRYDEALSACEQASLGNELEHEIHFIKASILECIGKPKAAREALKRVIYLEPKFAPAYIELAANYEQTGAQQRAKKLRDVALEQLRAMSDDEAVEVYEHMRVGDLIEQLELLQQATGEN